MARPKRADFSKCTLWDQSAAVQALLGMGCDKERVMAVLTAARDSGEPQPINVRTNWSTLHDYVLPALVGVTVNERGKYRLTVALDIEPARVSPLCKGGGA